MSTRHRDDALAWEQSVNERYLDATRQHDMEAASHGMKAVSTPLNTAWTDNAPKLPTTRRVVHPLIGRVSLLSPDEDLAEDFYVGDRYTVLAQGTTVVGWTADVARLFFEGRSAKLHAPASLDPREVAARRTFKSGGEQLTDFEDDVETGVDPDSAFPTSARLSVPAPPPTATRPVPAAPSARRTGGERSSDRVGRSPTTESARPRGSSHGPSASRPHRAVHPRPMPETVGPARSTSVPTPADQANNTVTDQPPSAPAESEKRAARLLQAALEEPKTGTLAPVLATLQPEQYRLVTWPSERNLVVQGHPGTGKTIVAAHRSAYLVLPKHDSERLRLDRVALVGPTDRWMKHIAPTVQGLVDEGVEVLSLESLIRAWSGDKGDPLHLPTERELHSRWAIGRIVDSAARTQKRQLRHLKRTERVRSLVNSLVRDTATHRKFVPREAPDLSDWLLDAGDYWNACHDRSYLLFLAAAGIVTGWLGAHGDQRHLVVDEAQDIRPLEWWMLSKLFRAGAPERWSIVGDMNQRRSDFTWTTWEEFAHRLELSDVDETPMLPAVLDDGYRSTQEILDYAAALLPRGMRKHSALRRGLEPLVRQVGPKQLANRSREEAERLAGHYSRGSVAVIASSKRKSENIERDFLQRGWRRADGEWLQRPSQKCRLSIVRPTRARGLEFDAVVVVEPAEFTPSLGRHGELYTSLTRANKELVVIHSKAMPRELRGRGNRVKA